MAGREQGGDVCEISQSRHVSHSYTTCLFRLMLRTFWAFRKATYLRAVRRIFHMSRRSNSLSPSPRAPKRAKLDHLTYEDFKNGVFLAPMVRSGARTQLTCGRWVSLTTRDSANPTFCVEAWRNLGLGPRDHRQGHSALGAIRRSYVQQPK